MPGGHGYQANSPESTRPIDSEEPGYADRSGAAGQHVRSEDRTLGKRHSADAVGKSVGQFAFADSDSPARAKGGTLGAAASHFASTLGRPDQPSG